MTDQSQRGLVEPTIRRDPSRRTEGHLPLDRTASDKGSAGVVWSSCLVVSFTVASLCSFVIAGHDGPRTMASPNAGTGQAPAAAAASAGPQDRQSPPTP